MLVEVYVVLNKMYQYLKTIIYQANKKYICLLTQQFYS